MKDKTNHPLSIRLIMGILFFQGLSGVVGGLGMVSDPSGSSMQLPLDLLEGSPFNDFLVPGLILLVVLGIGPLIVLYRVWKRLSMAWTGTLLVAVGLIIWIGVEIAMIGYHSEPPLQLIYGLLGILLLALALWPGVRKFIPR